jgi:hypothetical protein
MSTLIERVQRASMGGYSIRWMIPCMKQEAFKKADVLFRHGIAADTCYYIASGAVRLSLAFKLQ